MLRGYPASLLTILSALNKHLSVSQITTEDLGGFQKSAASFVIRSVLSAFSQVILQSSKIGLDRIFAVIITSPVAAKEQRSNKTEITAKTRPKLVSCDYYANHKTTCGVRTQSRCVRVKNGPRP